jgi:hypothetical protein
MNFGWVDNILWDKKGIRSLCGFFVDGMRKLEIELNFSPVMRIIFISLCIATLSGMKFNRVEVSFV